MIYAVVIPTNYKSPAMACFQEVADATAGVLRDLGHGAFVQYGAPPAPHEARTILFAPHLALFFGFEIPEGSICYQMEQIGAPYFTPRVVRMLNEHELWDYSAVNAARYGEVGLKAPKVVPIAWHAAFERFKRGGVEKDLDVVHVGGLSERRSRILTELQRRRINVQHVEGVYGFERDRILARAKLVLNVHYYEQASIFESTRVGYCAANGVPVLSELCDGGEGEGLAEFVKYDDLADRAVELLSAPDALQRLTTSARHTFRKTSFLNNVLQAL